MELVSCEGWEAVFGQDRAVAILRGMLERGEVPHALLFTGPRGVGKRTTALLFSAALLCPSGTPDACPSCLRVARGTHPDLHLVEPEGAQILIEQVRDLERELSLKPQEARRKVAVIDEAASMNESAANAFLKTLEEPPPGTCIILVTAAAEGLLPTIASRCQEVRFSPLGRREVEEYLRREMGMSSEEAERLARLSGGIFGRALLWARRPELAGFRERGVEAAAAVGRSALSALLERVREVQEEAARVEAPVREEAREAYRKALDRRVAERMEKRWQEALKRENARMRRQAIFDFLDGMASFYRDIMLIGVAGVAEGAPGGAPLVNLEWREDLENEVLLTGPGEAARRLRALGRAKKALEANVDQGLVMDWLMLEIKGAR
ncbi:MAG: DNA polymerase III subunit delta' [Actinomycetota bacterium]|nr:DNA polymerase III subunit delta' [Actinomycetota bacterium]